MTTIIYTAKRELTGVTAENATAYMEIGISEHTFSRSVLKDSPRAKGGARETLYHRADEIHNITFQPVNGALKDQLNEFLASTESGEEFQLYLYGDEATPVTVVRDDEGHAEQTFMRIGSRASDYMQASITVMEA